MLDDGAVIGCEPLGCVPFGAMSPFGVVEGAVPVGDVIGWFAGGAAVAGISPGDAGCVPSGAMAVPVELVDAPAVVPLGDAVPLTPVAAPPLLPLTFIVPLAFMLPLDIDPELLAVIEPLAGAVVPGLVSCC